MGPNEYAAYMAKPETQESAEQRHQANAASGAASVRKRLGDFTNEFYDLLTLGELEQIADIEKTLNDIMVRCGR